MLAACGTRPKVFLGNLGSAADFTVRATFAKNFFAAGGIEAMTNEGFADCDAMLAAFKASGASLACLCSSDEIYAQQAAAAASALKAANAHVYLAGRPGEHEQSLRDAAIAGFIFAGCDALAVLREIHARIAR